jgi:hypothetical protein
MPAKRCPMCHRASEDRAWHCRCGYEFGQDLAKTRELLRDQLTNAKIMLGLFITLELGSALLIWVAVQCGFTLAPEVAGLVASAWVVARSIRKLRVSRESLKLLAPKHVPQARVVR